MTDMENGGERSQVEEENKILEIQDLAVNKQSSVVSKNRTAKVSSEHQIHQEQPDQNVLR